MKTLTKTKQQGKEEIRLGEQNNMHLNPTDTVGCGNPTDTGNVPLVPSQSAGLRRSGSIQGLVPVVDSQNNPLLPCKPSVAWRLVKAGKATPFYKKSFFAIRLCKAVEYPSLKKVVIAIDPGSKRTGITVATENDVVLNIQCDTPDWVKKKIETKRQYRRARRYRNTPYRICRFNRKIGNLPPSTKARWQAHLRIINVLRKILPITNVVIEDIKAKTKKHARKWNKQFSPLEVGKQWFADQVKGLGLDFNKFAGSSTYNQRNYRGFKKTGKKLSEVWGAHCVDSHCLAELLFGELEPVKKLRVLDFMNWHRRELHQGYKKGGVRRLYGSTRSLGLNRGTLIRHPKYGLCYVGGTARDRISVHSLDGERLARNVKVTDCKILTQLHWRVAIPLSGKSDSPFAT